MQATILHSRNFEFAVAFGKRYEKAVRETDIDMQRALSTLAGLAIRAGAMLVVGTLDATDAADAFRLSQNDTGTFEAGWTEEGARSTSVGDLIRDDDSGVTVVVLPVGFAPLRITEPQLGRLAGTS